MSYLYALLRHRELEMASRSLSDILASVPRANSWKLDREIDFENKTDRGQTIPKHLGMIAEAITSWEGTVADNLGLTKPDRNDIRVKHPFEAKLQRREALSIWKSRLGSLATYRALIEVFYNANELAYADYVCHLLGATGPGGVAGALPTSDMAAQSGLAAGVAQPGSSFPFSARMRPEQLAQWLLQEYGEAYQADTDKLKSELINGELFLSLPDDAEFLQQLNLSAAFKRLVVGKAKQLKQAGGSSETSLPISAPANLPPGHNTLPPSTTVGISTPNTTVGIQETKGRLLQKCHPSLYTQLSNHAAKWWEIGIYLGFNQGELSNIESRPSLLMMAPRSWLSEMLSEWLQWTPGDGRGSTQYATLDGLKSAVSKAGLGRTAEELHL